MTDHDDIRDALSSYAGSAPDLDPRAGLRERIARRDRARRAAVAGVACLAAAVAGTGVAVLSADRTRGTTGIVAADHPFPTEAPASEEPTPDATPDATPKPSPLPEEEEPTGEPTDDPAPTTAPTTGEPEPPSTAYPSPPDAPGLRASATIDPASLPTATYATLRVQAEDGDGRARVTAVRWGDGTAEEIAIAMPSCYWPDPKPTSRPPEPSKGVEEFAHAWRQDGSYTVKVTVGSWTDCAYPPAESETKELEVTVVVTAGEVVSNGPKPPVADHLNVDDLEGRPKRERFVSSSISDPDGYVGSATVDWGDGSDPVVVENDTACDDGDGRHYPGGSLRVYDTRTLEPGTYTLTITWSSAGCDGATVQSGSKSIQYEVT